jgi:regulator of replication initiation timing
MTSLFGLDQQFKKLLLQDELTNDDLVAIDNLNGLIEDKIVGYACIIQEMKDKYEATYNAILNANNKLNRISKNIEKLEKRVMEYLTENGIAKIDKHPLFDVYIKKNRTSVDDYNHSEIPEKYWKKKETLAIDKTKIKEDIENLGLIIPGARLINKLILKIG